MDELICEKREQILEIAKRHGARNVRVFGSAAKTGLGPESDIDFIVDLSDEVTPFFPGGLIADLEELLGREIQVLTEEALHSYIKREILDQAVPL